jgi:hypothetical protein
VRRGDLRSEAGFSFLEVLMAMSVLLLGSVAVLSLFAVGVNDLVQRRIDAKLEIVRPEVRTRIQDWVDRTPPGKDPENMPPKDGDPNVALSQPGWSFRARFAPSGFGRSGWLAKTVIYLNDRPTRVLPPIPVVRSTIDPNEVPK